MCNRGRAIRQAGSYRHGSYVVYTIHLGTLETYSCEQGWTAVQALMRHRLSPTQTVLTCPLRLVSQLPVEKSH